MKFCTALLVVLAIVSSFFVRSVKADILTIQVPYGLQVENISGKRFEKVIFVPVKRKQIFGFSNEKLASEVIYYFHKHGFKDTPVSHIIFETGSIITINKDWFTSTFANNQNTKVLLVLLVYEDSYDPQKFHPLVTDWTNTFLKPALPFAQISDINAIETGGFSIEGGENPKIFFKDLKHRTDYDATFAALDLKTKSPQTLKLVTTEIPPSQKPDVTLKLKVALKNTSGFTAVLANDNQLLFKFTKDSQFFVNNLWLNQKTVAMFKDGVIRPDETKEYEISLRSPIIPGKMEEDLVIMLGDRELATQKVGFQIEDIGQKILKINTNSFDSIPVRQKPDTVSQEVARTGRGQIHTYDEVQNGYYKIHVYDKQGWIPARYVEVITKK